ncbi:hypothetical protein BDR26DRAFT_1008592 [Obelidium mucronatum]|nr:hypothetical protein BDR26DRAFT_1008592 [Obelidium mucronatum]
MRQQPQQQLAQQSLCPSLMSNDLLPLEPEFGTLCDTLVTLDPLSFVNQVPSITPVDAALFENIVKEVKAAIEAGVYPERIVKGSSGSYFCKNRAGQIIAVFKPKNEEPYGNMNPKWTKWIHKNLLPCCFGRSCLIPNSGYLSEAAASFVDLRLGLNVVPRTEVVALASPTFFYTWYEKWMYVRGLRPLPLKLGSFQLFLNGFKDATTFFQNGYDQALQQQQHHHHPPATSSSEEEEQEDTPLRPSESTISLTSPAHPCMDNWMIRYVDETTTETATPAASNSATSTPPPTTNATLENNPSTATLLPEDAVSIQIEAPPPTYTTIPPPSGTNSITVAAIDNGLAFPFKHPDRWRAYPYGWAYLPIAKIPFSKSTRDQVLYFLTSQQWWKETLDGLERIFRLDPDFNEDMWRKQRGVMRGEGYNLAEVLRRSEIGDVEGGSPWGLVRRPVVAVYEEEEDSDDEAEGNQGGYNDRSALVGTGIAGTGSSRMNSNSSDSGVEPHHHHHHHHNRGRDMIRRFRRRVRQRFETFHEKPAVLSALLN